ncbi:unnamed protein product [Leptidea sinapis]|uniref:Odorant receptor n=1 Tax=Leptidea sinapis TaxID=189913 RepID=A0A5E4Q0J2_9NEOP|nr:unnamed protein product [Leptidea sinapis]
MTVLTFIYEILLNLSIVYAPKRIDVILNEATFAINGGVLVLKTLLVLIYRKEIIEALEILNNEQFNSTDEVTRNIIERDNKMYSNYMRIMYTMGSIVCVKSAVLPLINNYLFGSEVQLPSSMYYFLDDEYRDKYFAYLYIYQAIGQYYAMLSDISIDGGQQLVFAVYCSQWMSRKQSFKRSLKLFMLRANVPIVMYGFKLFTISLDTFTKILKSAYSFAALVKNFMENEE